MAFGGNGGGALRSAINVTPLVDVVLVLLIIFMCLSPPVLKETDLKVPDESVVEQTPVADEPLEVRVQGDGTLKYGGETVELSALLRELGTAISERRARGKTADSKIVFFDVDDGASFGRVIEVFDACRGLGVETLGLIPKQPAAGTDPPPQP